ncbi:SHD1 domain-containing protein [Kiritimatiellota bacterium B12222]|nr:SHD1 domain-containing protein [Kiritimatiellota bacterium B12222]
MRKFVCLGLLLWGGLQGLRAEMRTWRALGGFKTEAEFVSYDAGMVTLRKSNDEVIQVRVEKLTANDRLTVLKLAGDHAHGAIPAGEIQKPTGRRELTWKPIVRGDVWPESMEPEVKNALLGLSRSWNHAETEYFIIHYQQLGFAKKVARMADFQYQYIAADLPGFEDRYKEKSHIIVVRNQKDWQEFLGNVDSVQNWFAAYVHGMSMFLYDTDSSTANAHILAHEMSHLVLNRFFVYQPPLWLNEGLAEWYGNVGHSAFKGKKVDVERGMGDLKQGYPVQVLTQMNSYPQQEAQIELFYATSQQVVGMLMLRKDQPAFVRFLKGITVDGNPFHIPLQAVYGFEDLSSFQRAFDDFLKK